MADEIEHNPDGNSEEVEWAVGYGSPPVAHRFKKGQSGNPKGRPKAVRKRPPVDDSGSLANMILAETSRVIPVLEGGKVHELPLETVIFRSLVTKAAKGDFRSQKLALDMTDKARREDMARKNALIEAAMKLKAHWTKLSETYRTEYPNWEVHPHPDDISIDPDTGYPVWKSPWLDHQHEKTADVIRKRDSWLEDLKSAPARLAEADGDEAKDFWIDDWKVAKTNVDALNAMLVIHDRINISRYLLRELNELTAQIEHDRLDANIGSEADD